MIKAVIFDYFGVVCSDEYWNSIRDLVDTREQFHELSEAVNTGRMHWHEFVSQIAAKTGQSAEEIERLYQSQQIHPPLVGYITKLRLRYKTALLSNASHEFLQPIIEKTHLDEVFDAIVMSSQVGVTKPNPRIYTYMLDQLGVIPEEAVLIDDGARNVDGAVEVGMQAVLYQNFEQLQQELEDLLKV